jgi:hypothetical protein
VQRDPDGVGERAAIGLTDDVQTTGPASHSPARRMRNFTRSQNVIGERVVRSDARGLDGRSSNVAMPRFDRSFM